MLNKCLSFGLNFRFEPFFADCTFEHSLNYPIFRHIPKSMVDNRRLDSSPFLLRMIIWTRPFFAPFHIALDSFIVCRMILLLFPSMTHVAVKAYLTSAAVIRNRDVIFGLPVETRLNRYIFTMG